MLPAWVYVLFREHNWIAGAVEAGGVPAMATGLIIALRGRGQEPRWLDAVARVSVVLGLALSCWEFGGIRTVTQLLELGIAAGFLLGTYLTARESIQGYFWLMLGHVTCAALMGLQGYYLLSVQQLASLFFVADACLVLGKKRRRQPSKFERTGSGD